MKRILTTAFLISLLLLGTETAKGTPFMRNFTTKEYNAHNRCFDILCDKYGPFLLPILKVCYTMTVPLGARFIPLASTG